MYKSWTPQNKLVRKKGQMFVTLMMAQIKENMEAEYHWPLWGEPPVTLAKGQLRGKVSFW